MQIYDIPVQHFTTAVYTQIYWQPQIFSNTQANLECAIYISNLLLTLTPNIWMLSSNRRVRVIANCDGKAAGLCICSSISQGLTWSTNSPSPSVL